jgi:transcriptional regulator with XRE-family HTH domain
MTQKFAERVWMSSGPRETIGSRIRRLRRAAGMAQADLAGSDLSASYISLIEAGKRIPSREVLVRLAHQLQCPVDHLLESVHGAGNDLEMRLRNGEMYLKTDDPARALQVFDEIAAMDGGHGPADLAPMVAWGRGRSLEGLGRLEEAAAVFEALHRDADTEDRVPRIQVAIALCRCCRELGDLARGIELGEQAVGHLDRLALAHSVESVQLISTLVGLYCERGDMHSANYLANTAIQRAMELRKPEALGAAYWNASLIAHQDGRRAEALMHIRNAYDMYSRADSERAVARLKLAYAAVLLRNDPPQPAEAVRLLNEAMTHLEGLARGVEIAYGESALSEAALLMGDPEKAVHHGKRSLECLGPGHRLEAARVQIVLAAAYLSQGQEQLAKETYERAAIHLEASQASRQAGFVWADFAEVLERSGEAERALWAYRQSLRCLGHSQSPVFTADA